MRQFMKKMSMKRCAYTLCAAFGGLVIFGSIGDGSEEYTKEICILSQGLFAVLFFVALVCFVCAFAGFLKRMIVEWYKSIDSLIASDNKKKLCARIRSQIFNTGIDVLRRDVQKFADKNGMNEAAVIQAVKATIPLVIDDGLADGILTDEEERSLDVFFNAYQISMEDIGQEGQGLLARGMLIRDLLEGTVSPRFNTANIPYKTIKDEVAIWGYQSMTVAEASDVHRLQGVPQGVSSRMGKGIYWRMGKVATKRVPSEEMKEIGTGIVMITSHHLYYHVGLNAKRIRHDNIFAITPYSNAVVVHIDEGIGKPLALMTDDTWFLVNILQNAHNWA